MESDEAVRRALCDVLNRLGADGVVGFLNNVPPDKLSDEIWDHVRWLEQVAFDRGREAGKKEPPF